MPRDPHRAHRRQRASFRLRLGIFITTSLIIIGTAVWLLRPQGGSSAAADITLEVTMGVDPARAHVTHVGRNRIPPL